MDHHDDIRSLEYRSSLLLGGLVALATVGCIRPNDEHCLFAGGDFAESDTSVICVVPTSTDRATLPLDEHGWHDLGMDRTGLRTLDAAGLPEGYLWVPFGLPRQFEGEDLQSVHGVFDAALTARTISEPCQRDYKDLEEQWETLAAYRTETLQKKTLLKLEEAALSTEDLASFNAALLELVVACDDMMPGTDTDSSSETGETDSETETDSMGSSSTTGSMPCVDNEDCPDADAPFCGMTEECGTCEATEDPDAACAGLDPMSPVCLGGACVQCTAEAPQACTGMTPVCDEESSLCVPCTAHDQCGEAACNLYTGECFPGDSVVHVGGREPEALPTIDEAVMSFDEGAQGTIVVHEGSYNESVTVGGGRVLAFLAADGDLPVWTRTSGRQLPQLTVNTGVTVLLDGIQLSANASSMVPALVVTGADSRAWLDRSRIVQNAGGGILAETMAQLTLRNCFVGDGANGANGLTVDGATADVLYTTLGAGFDNFEDVFPVFCSGAVDVSIRNSLLVSSDNPAELSCAMATVTYSASESLIPGTGNVGLGDVAADWFLDFAAGNFGLDNPPPMLATTARWRTDDPSTDIDGDLRPTDDDTPDYAGADVP